MHFLKFVKFYRISILQKTDGRLLSISSNISDISFALLAINQQLTVYLGPPQRTVCKQVTVFVAKIFKITKVEGHIFCGWGRCNKQKRVFSRSSHPDVFCKKKRSEVFAKTHRKTLKSFFRL